MAGNPETRPFCNEAQHTPLWGGRMCWNRASYLCPRCGKTVCLAHRRITNEGAVLCICGTAMAPLP
jgi:hypothetical protein